MVRAESDGSLLLESKIQPDTAYQKQQDTLIVWSEGDNFDLALSFQEKAGCDEIWEKICQVCGFLFIIFEYFLFIILIRVSFAVPLISVALPKAFLVFIIPKQKFGDLSIHKCFRSITEVLVPLSTS